MGITGRRLFKEAQQLLIGIFPGFGVVGSPGLDGFTVADYLAQVLQIPVFADEPAERVQISSALSALTLVTIVLFAVCSVVIGIM